MREVLGGRQHTVWEADTSASARTVTAEALLSDAEQAFLRADFGDVRPLLRRIENEFGGPVSEDYAARYAVLRSALAARVGNWPEAVRRCPGSDDLSLTETGVVHALALGALRRLSEDGVPSESGTAALAILLWAYLLDKEDTGGFRALLTERRGIPVPDEVWEKARRHLLGRITDLLHALDARAGRDALAAWETAWEAERATPVVAPADAGPEGLIPLGHAARYLVDHGHRPALLDAYTARHPDPGTWRADSPEHSEGADALARALTERGQDWVRAGGWSEALADFSTAARLGLSLGPAEQAAVLRAGKNVGRGRNGQGYSSIMRIQGLELAHALLPSDSSLAAELTAELVRVGREVFDRDPRQSVNRFTRAVVVSPQDPDARSGLDDHLRVDLQRALDGAEPRITLRAGEVQGLLKRDPDCAAARRWLGSHYAEQAVAEASRGRTSEARSAVGKMLRYGDHAGPHGKDRVDRTLSGLLIDAARSVADKKTRAGMEHRVDLLSAAVDIMGPARGDVREELDTVLLHLAEHLEDTASPSDVIQLFLRDRMRVGASARFDRIVEAAYLHRAKIREREGDLGGARRDRACAARITGGLTDRGLLFGPALGRPLDEDTGQESLF